VFVKDSMATNETTSETKLAAATNFLEIIVLTLGKKMPYIVMYFLKS